jgi:hypothetical protein
LQDRLFEGREDRGEEGCQVSKYGAIGQNADGSTNYGLLPPFDPSSGERNYAELAVAEQKMVDLAWSTSSASEGASAFEAAATYAEQRGRVRPAALYRRAAARVKAGKAFRSLWPSKESR